MYQYLTKSNFLVYLDAPMHLWAIKNHKIKEEEIDEFLKHLIDQGYEVEKEAEVYIETVLKKDHRYKDSEILLQEKVIDHEFYARPDILIRNQETHKWDMYEIKSSTGVDKRNKYDATFQSLIVNKKYDLGEIYILHLDPDYVRGDELNSKELFVVNDITEDVESKKEEVNILRYEALDVVRDSNVENISKCIRPKLCPCVDICHPDLPNYSIFDINNFTRSEKKVRSLIEAGIIEIKDVPNDFPLSDNQRFQVEVAKSGEVFIDKEKIRTELESLEFPLYFIDYETFNPAIPIFKGFSPYTQINFQWSLHVLENVDSKFKHFEFLWDKDSDPTVHFLKELQKVIGTSGNIIVWNKAFEASRNTEMGKIYPEFEEFVINMNERIYDLMDIFKYQYYADPQIKGSYSIKNVLPALIPEFSYKELEIANGASAMSEWSKLAFTDLNQDKKERIISALLKYCKMDTLAMVKIFEKLNEITCND